MGSTLERHPFSGLIHSAGELLHRGSTTHCGLGLDYIKISMVRDSSCLVCRPPRSREVARGITHDIGTMGSGGRHTPSSLPRIDVL